MQIFGYMNGYEWVKLLFCLVTYYTLHNTLVACRIFPERESLMAFQREIKKRSKPQYGSDQNTENTNELDC